MRRFFLSLLCVATATLAFSQVDPSTQSKGTQAAEDGTLIPHESALDVVPVSEGHESTIQNPTATPTDHPPKQTKEDARANKKERFHNFLTNRVLRKAIKAQMASITQHKNADSGGLVGALLIILLVLVIVLLLLEISPFLWGTLGTILIILLILWLLGVI